MQNIFLIGFMATGKTSIGKLLATKLNCEFLDTDDIIEQNEKRNISDIFRTDGEGHFRKLEHELVQSINGMDKVYSMGGGVPAFNNNLKLLKAKGIVITLLATPKAIMKRLKAEPNKRPLLDVENFEETLQSLLQNRAYFYSSAHHLIDTTDKSVQDIASEVIKCIQR